MCVCVCVKNFIHLFISIPSHVDLAHPQHQHDCLNYHFLIPYSFLSLHIFQVTLQSFSNSISQLERQQSHCCRRTRACCDAADHHHPQDAIVGAISCWMRLLGGRVGLNLYGFMFVFKKTSVSALCSLSVVDLRSLSSVVEVSLKLTRIPIGFISYPSLDTHAQTLTFALACTLSHRLTSPSPLRLPPLSHPSHYLIQPRSQQSWRRGDLYPRRGSGG